MAEIEYIDAKKLQSLFDNPNLLIYDIRETDEYVREHIVGAKNIPISSFEPDKLTDLFNKILVFHCQSGNRTKINEYKLKQIKCEKIFILKNGIAEWKKLGCAVAINNKAPLPIMRQVQIVAGLLILLGVIGGFLFTPKLFWLSGFIGAGLLFAGVSGYCGMANLLMLMPYNSKNKCVK